MYTYPTNPIHPTYLILYIHLTYPIHPTSPIHPTYPIHPIYILYNMCMYVKADYILILMKIGTVLARHGIFRKFQLALFLVWY